LNSSIKEKEILITKSKSEAEKSVRLLTDAGAKLIYFPTIKIIPNYNSAELIDAGNNFDEFDYIIFTSVNSVDIFNNFAAKNNCDISKLKVAVVGRSTYESCKGLGINVNILPDEFSAKGLLRYFSQINLIGIKIFIPGSSLSRDELSIGLMELGAKVKSVPIYDVVKNNSGELQEEISYIEKRKPDVFLFTSPSSFENFLSIADVEQLQDYFVKSVIAAIGTTTEKAIRKFNLTVNIVPQIFTVEGASEAILKYFNITANMA